MSGRRHGGATAIALLLVLGRAVAVLAAPGDLDPTFGTGGIVTTTVGGVSASANAALLQADGRIVACGSTPVSEPGRAAFAVARFDADGSLDPTFSADGQVSTTFDVPLAEPGAANQGALLQMPDGSLRVEGGTTGYVDTGVPSDWGAELTYHSDGEVVITSSVSWSRSGARVALLLQPDQRLLLLGTESPLSDELTMSLGRENPDGSAGDGTFATNAAIAHLAPARESALLLQPDGRIVVTVFRGVFGLARFGSDGTPDASFAGAGGAVVANVLDGADSMAVASQPDGKIVVAGQAGSARSQFALARFTPDGLIDPTFGTNGTTLTDFGVDAVLHDLVVESNGRLVAGGEAVALENGAPKSLAFLLARYNPDGSPDTSFGSEGMLRTDLEGGAGIRQLLLQPDGRLVAVGTVALADGTSKFALARYELGGQLPGGGEGSCYSAPSCLRRLVTALPVPGAVLQRRARRVAFRLSELSARASASLETAAARQGQTRRAAYGRARRALRTLLALARRADRQHVLGVPLEPITEVATRLLAVLG